MRIVDTILAPNIISTSIYEIQIWEFRVEYYKEFRYGYLLGGKVEG